MTFDRPDLQEIDITTVLHALSDPARLDTVKRLAGCTGLSCNEGMPCEELPKSTRSNHYKILRQAGLVETERRGRKVINRLRRDDVDRRFPGLLDSLLTA